MIIRRSHFPAAPLSRYVDSGKLNSRNNWHENPSLLLPCYYYTFLLARMHARSMLLALLRPPASRVGLRRSPLFARTYLLPLSGCLKSYIEHDYRNMSSYSGWSVSSIIRQSRTDIVQPVMINWIKNKQRLFECILHVIHLGGGETNWTSEDIDLTCGWWHVLN